MQSRASYLFWLGYYSLLLLDIRNCDWTISDLVTSKKCFSYSSKGWRLSSSYYLLLIMRVLSLLVASFSEGKMTNFRDYCCYQMTVIIARLLVLGILDQLFPILKRVFMLKFERVLLITTCDILERLESFLITVQLILCITSFFLVADKLPLRSLRETTVTCLRGFGV